jgi:hypothetical protein
MPKASLYEGYSCLALFFLALVLLIAGVWAQVNYTVYLMALLFLLWDVGFIFRKKKVAKDQTFAGRDTDEVLSHSRDAETLMSYFIGFYAAVLALVFTDAGKTQAFLAACKGAAGGADIPMYLLAAPLVLAAIPMLFIPVDFDKDKKTITRGLEMVTLVNIYCEKLVVFIFVHDILRISRALLHPSAG